MDWELHQKLKDVRFPIKDNKECEIGNCYENKHNHCFPTFSELIVACRNEIGWTDQFMLHVYKHGFVIERAGMDDMRICDTPEESVANLWLELNKK